MQNKYPWWKNVLLVVLFLVGLLYALPMLYGDDPAIQISAKGSAHITSQVIQKVNTTLERDKLQSKSVAKDRGDLLVRFLSTDTQLKARDILQKALGNNYEVAINLAPRTPKWLAAIGAQPMRLGLDLRGGVFFSIRS